MLDRYLDWAFGDGESYLRWFMLTNVIFYALIGLVLVAAVAAGVNPILLLVGFGFGVALTFVSWVSVKR